MRSQPSATRDRFEVHTNFTGRVQRVYPFQLANLAAPSNLDVLRRLFTEPNSLRPDQTTARVTEQAAELFTQAADGRSVFDQDSGAILSLNSLYRVLT